MNSIPAATDAGGDVRTIAFYLPQFHPVPDNDEWWGKGFTEWRNVAKAKPLFPGHYQPHLPADLGYYDLRVPETRERQAELAREYGIHGFCYYHYWFNGKRLLDRPFAEVLASGKPDLPFCLCWANENWTRRWDGQDQEVLARQIYSPEDDLDHIRSLIPAFKDPRYIRVEGKPLFLVYRVNSLPQPAETAEIWRREAVAAGLPGLYLCVVSSLPELHFDATQIGFDAAIDFQPDWGRMPHPSHSLRRKLRCLLKPDHPECVNTIRHYPFFAQRMMDRPERPYKEFPGVLVGWDNSARRKSGAIIFKGSDPETYGRWLRQTVNQARRTLSGDERLVFINAWNEWAEGNHLEPDMKWGRRYLEATREALESTDE